MEYSVKFFNINLYSVISEQANKHEAGWKPQLTQGERLFAKIFNNKVFHSFDITNSSNEETRPSIYKYSLSDRKATVQSFQMSQGLNPSDAIFIPEKNGKISKSRDLQCT